MPDYPTSAFNPATRSSGQTIAASHMNDVQAEIRGIELALLTSGLAHNLLFVDATYDIGASGATRPRDLFLSRNATIGGTLAVTGVTTLALTTITAVLTLDSGRIGFPASQSVSSNANTLDDYEEGTWTPSDGSGAALSFTTVEGQYVKIGQLVVASATLTYPSTADGSNARINGFPFAANGTNAIYGSSPNFTDDGTMWTLNLQPAGTHALFYRLDGTQITNATLTTNVVRFTIVYRATA